LPTGGNGSSPASRRREDKKAVNVYLGAADRGKVYRGDLPGRTPALPSNQDPVEPRLKGLLLQWSGEKEHFHKNIKEVNQKENGTPKKGTLQR
jgi:hypothetical protein